MPIVAYGAYDTPTYNVDLTPFIPMLADGKHHVITLDVVSDEVDHTVNPNWYLSGNIQVRPFLLILCLNSSLLGRLESFRETHDRWHYAIRSPSICKLSAYYAKNRRKLVLLQRNRQSQSSNRRGYHSWGRYNIYSRMESEYAIYERPTISE
jgi:hypothetical protein